MRDALKKLAMRIMDSDTSENSDMDSYYKGLMDKRSERARVAREKYNGADHFKEDIELESRVSDLMDNGKSDDDLEKEARLNYIRECIKRGLDPKKGLDS
jgi:hypothetical protein